MRCSSGLDAARSCRELAYALQHPPAAGSAQHIFASRLRVSRSKSNARQVLRLRQLRYSHKPSCVTQQSTSFDSIVVQVAQGVLP